MGNKDKAAEAVNPVEDAAKGELEPKKADDKKSSEDKKSAKGDSPETPAANDADQERDFSYTQNREISWLRFDDRVLDEAFDESVPLFERLKFCSIFESNLNEWFMIRVGGLSDLASLKNQPRDNKSNNTPSEQLDDIFKVLPKLVDRHEQALSLVEGELERKGLVRISPDAYTEADRAALSRHFARRLAPIISPLIVDPRHPFPNLRNGRLFVACSLDGPAESGVLGVIEVPASESRVVALPSADKVFRYTLVEDVLRTFIDQCFGDYVPKRSAVLRVTRNADIDPDGEGVEEEEDYRQHMKKVLKLRQRLQPVRLEIQGKIGNKLETFVVSELKLEDRRVFHMTRPLDLGYVFGLEGSISDSTHAECVFGPFEPQASPMVKLSKPVRPQVEDHDVLLVYPYESMDPFLRLVREASADDACISIKITLYRVATRSHLCESLIAAAEAGKEVTVLMELRARFDEENNIAWAERLEDAGCTVIYGSEGFKCHSKICQITYHDGGEISRLTCLGTGNFNEKTARLYSDFLLMTANPGIGEDGNTFFRNLSLGNLRGTYKNIGVAPISLKPLVMRGLDREIERARAGRPAQVFLKMNSLTDRDVIDKISEASEAGVKVLMIVRGICCIRANVPGKTDGLVVREIVGRFLEHARVYAFGIDADTIYLSSADMMTRNTERRVEIAFPVTDPTCRSLVTTFINLQLADNVKARELTSEGTWGPVASDPDAPRVNSQEVLLAIAYRRAHLGDEALSLTPVSRILPDLSGDELRAIISAPAVTTYAADDQPDLVAAEPSDTAEQTASDEPEVVVEEAPLAEPEPVPEAPAPEAVEPVRAAPAPEPAASAPAPQPVKCPEPEPQRRAGRISTAFSLIGRGFRTLFTGR